MRQPLEFDKLLERKRWQEGDMYINVSLYNLKASAVEDEITRFNFSSKVPTHKAGPVKNK